MQIASFAETAPTEGTVWTWDGKSVATQPGRSTCCCVCLPPEVIITKCLKAKYFMQICFNRNITLFSLLGRQKPHEIFIVWTFISQIAKMSGGFWKTLNGFSSLGSGPHLLRTGIPADKCVAFGNQVNTDCFGCLHWNCKFFIFYFLWVVISGHK